MNVSNGAPFLMTVISAASADETLGQPLNYEGFSLCSVWVEGNGTTSSGVITIEEAAYDPNVEPPYGGTWSPITTVNASDVSTGLTKAIHISNACFSWIRCRISTAIGGGGTVTVRQGGC